MLDYTKIAFQKIGCITKKLNRIEERLWQI